MAIHVEEITEIEKIEKNHHFITTIIITDSGKIRERQSHWVKDWDSECAEICRHHLNLINKPNITNDRTKSHRIPSDMSPEKDSSLIQFY